MRDRTIEMRNSLRIVAQALTDWLHHAGIPTKLQSGIQSVPYDNYPATLHKGERVLTAAEARSGGVTITVPITVNGDAGPQAVQRIRKAVREELLRAMPVINRRLKTA